MWIRSDRGVEKCFCDKNITICTCLLVSKMCVQSIQSQSENWSGVYTSSEKTLKTVNEYLGPPFTAGNKPYGAA